MSISQNIKGSIELLMDFSLITFSSYAIPMTTVLTFHLGLMDRSVCKIGYQTQTLPPMFVES